MERDRSRDPDPEVFDRDNIDWPAPQKDQDYEPAHNATTPLDEEEDRRWLR
jgi:hypothetical protein